MQDLFIRNTSGDLVAMIETDLEKLKKVNEMYEALRELFHCSYGLDTQNRKVFRMEMDEWNKIKSLFKEIEK